MSTRTHATTGYRPHNFLSKSSRNGHGNYDTCPQRARHTPSAVDTPSSLRRRHNHERRQPRTTSIGTRRNTAFSSTQHHHHGGGGVLAWGPRVGGVSRSGGAPSGGAAPAPRPGNGQSGERPTEVRFLLRLSYFSSSGRLLWHGHVRYWDQGQRLVLILVAHTDTRYSVSPLFRSTTRTSDTGSSACSQRPFREGSLRPRRRAASW